MRTDDGCWTFCQCLIPAFPPIAPDLLFSSKSVFACKCKAPQAHTGRNFCGNATDTDREDKIWCSATRNLLHRTKFCLI